MTDSANSWTDERLEQLRKLWDDGLSISQIGEALGVSRNAIAGKAHRMGLPKRPSPISKTTTEVKKPAKAKKLGSDLWRGSKLPRGVISNHLVHALQDR